MYFTYTLILAVGLVVSFPYYLVRSRKYLHTLADRLGFLKLPQLRQAIWVHAVSVGEVKAVENLLERLRQQFPAKPIVVSTATPTGQELARQRPSIVDHTFYFPIDLPWCVRRTVDRVDPEMVIIAETEIWPNFLRVCRTRGVRVAMINGRISDRSFARYRFARRWLRRVFEDYTIIGMQSEMDRQRIAAIGADPEKVAVFGNLKYDIVRSNRPLDDSFARLLAIWNPIWIAASTMPGEEDYVLNAFAELRTTTPQLKLLIAPRHAERFDAVEETVRRRDFTCLRRSRIATEETGLPEPRQHGTGEGAASTASVLLLDTIGELSEVFRYGTVVFVGGSLVPKGGHNILEPARHRQPIVFGPHMENFRDMARIFLEQDAAIQIDDPEQLAPIIGALLSNAGRSSELGERAFGIVQQNSGATDRVLRVLKPAEARR